MWELCQGNLSCLFNSNIHQITVLPYKGIQGSHRLEKALNLEQCLEKALNLNLP